MGKKRKKRQSSAASRKPAPEQLAEESSPPPPPERSLIDELLRHPTLLLAWISLGITIFAASAAYRFRDQMEMGAIREPTGSIIWAAITITLFASYWRQARREMHRKDQ